MKQVNILMMGGKRCGKTTVLASMYSEINKALSGTALKLEVDDQTRLDLENAKSSIERKMDDFKIPLTRVEGSCTAQRPCPQAPSPLPSPSTWASPGILPSLWK